MRVDGGRRDYSAEGEWGHEGSQTCGGKLRL